VLPVLRRGRDVAGLSVHIYILGVFCQGEHSPNLTLRHLGALAISSNTPHVWINQSRHSSWRCAIPPHIAVSDFVRRVKGRSSHDVGSARKRTVVEPVSQPRPMKCGSSTQASLSRAMVEAERPPACLPSKAASASSKSPVDMPFR
jgi:hypothetical protein